MAKITPEMNSAYQNTPESVYYTYIFEQFVENVNFTTVLSGHLGFAVIKKFAQGCHSGNQAKFVQEVLVHANQQKNFIGNTIARSIMESIGVSNRLYQDHCC